MAALIPIRAAAVKIILIELLLFSSPGSGKSASESNDPAFIKDEIEHLYFNSIDYDDDYKALVKPLDVDSAKAGKDFSLQFDFFPSQLEDDHVSQLNFHDVSSVRSLGSKAGFDPSVLFRKDSAEEIGTEAKDQDDNTEESQTSTGSSPVNSNFHNQTSTESLKVWANETRSSTETETLENSKSSSSVYGSSLSTKDASSPATSVMNVSITPTSTEESESWRFLNSTVQRSESSKILATLPLEYVISSTTSSEKTLPMFPSTLGVNLLPEIPTSTGLVETTSAVSYLSPFSSFNFATNNPQRAQIVAGFESIGPVQVLLPTIVLGQPSQTAETVYLLPQPYETVQILIPAGAWPVASGSRRASEPPPQLTATVVSVPNSTSLPGLPCGPMVLLGPSYLRLQLPLLIAVPCSVPRPSLGAGWQAGLFYVNAMNSSFPEAQEWQRELVPQGKAYENETVWGQALLLSANAGFWTSAAGGQTEVLVTGFVLGGVAMVSMAALGTWAMSRQLQSHKSSPCVFPSLPDPESPTEQESFSFVFRKDSWRRRRKYKKDSTELREDGLSAGEASFAVDFSSWSGPDTSGELGIEEKEMSGPPADRLRQEDVPKGNATTAIRPFPRRLETVDSQPLWVSSSPTRHMHQPTTFAAERRALTSQETIYPGDFTSKGQAEVLTNYSAGELHASIKDQCRTNPSGSESGGEHSRFQDEIQCQPSTQLCEERLGAQLRSRREPPEEISAPGANRALATAVSADVRHSLKERRVIRLV